MRMAIDQIGDAARSVCRRHDMAPANDNDPPDPPPAAAMRLPARPADLVDARAAA